MVNVTQMQRGLVNFVDREIAPHLSGWEKVVIGGGASLIANKMPAVVETIAAYPIVSALDLYRDGEVDIDAIYSAIKPYIGTEPFAVKIPVVGVTLKMGHREIADLVKFIKEA